MIVRLALILLLSVSSVWADGTTYEVTNRTLDRQQGNARATIEHPYIQGLGESLDQGLNLEFERRAEALAESFFREAKETLDSLPEDSIFKDRELFLGIEYEVKHESDRLLVILMSGSQYLGGAHPNPVFYLLMLDPRTGQRVAVADLFELNSDFLVRLAEEVREGLSHRPDGVLGDEDWVKAGTEPLRENYDLVWPEEDRLVVLFPPYQIAPYVSGPQTVEVPLSSLGGILNYRFFLR